MTLKDAKRELRPIKDMEKAVIALDMEIERLETAATKMTANYAAVKITGSPENKLEKAAMELAGYREQLEDMRADLIEQKNKCISKVGKIEPDNLRTVLLLYYFQNNTLERTAEIIGKSYQWTYELFRSALKEYCKISDGVDTN